jgi:hypothetical protein
MIDDVKTAQEIRRVRELGINMLETLVVTLQTILDFSRKNNVTVPNNISYLIEEATRLIQELNSECPTSLKSPKLPYFDSSDDFYSVRNPTKTLQSQK